MDPAILAPDAPPSASQPSPSWIGYLTAVTISVIAFGVLLVLAPAAAEALFGIIIFGGSFPEAYAPAMGYIRLAHAVMGAVILGWFVQVLWLVRSPVARGEPGAWYALTFGLLAWYVLDTGFSLLSGFWQNAALNTVFLLLYVPGLAGTRP